ncbi:MAG: hypothetical protein CVT92_14310 [Bacteroidetes bacterium HGW-Bacteroidetes-1]|jgi:hypothetical protein|nr:MAG: hypothetical protein CVT92_14310 [Bacteroidetes bacterium HGW-Bacteroidetes-1]
MNIPSRAYVFCQSVFDRFITQNGTLTITFEEFLFLEIDRQKSMLSPEHKVDILNGSLKRHLSVFIQLFAKTLGINSGLIDGFWGPQTDYAFWTLIHYDENGCLPPLWRDYEIPDINPNHWPDEKENEMIAFYGQPGDESKHVYIQLPYELCLAWDISTKLKRLLCHQKVEDSLLRVLTAVRLHYGDNEIKTLRLDRFGGCYNYRRKRGGSSWSTHAWAIALDFDPDRNQLQWGRDRAHFAKPEYDFWWSCWEKEGWVSLGRKSNYDWMHLQAAR